MSYHTARKGIALTLAVIAPAACGSSPDAWQAFRDQVRASCLAQTPFLPNPTIFVEPFGTQRHGVALIHGAEKGSTSAEVRVCIYDKANRTAEVTGPVPDVVLQTPGAASARLPAAR